MEKEVGGLEGSWQCGGQTEIRDNGIKDMAKQGSRKHLEWLRVRSEAETDGKEKDIAPQAARRDTGLALVGRGASCEKDQFPREPHVPAVSTEGGDAQLRKGLSRSKNPESPAGAQMVSVI